LIAIAMLERVNGVSESPFDFFLILNAQNLKIIFETDFRIELDASRSAYDAYSPLY